jgi:ligand-binding sensor domain-containing protein
MNKSILFLFTLVLFTCSDKKQEYTANLIQPKIVAAKGYLVPKDSIAEPVIIQIDESKLKKIPAGKPTVVSSNEYENPGHEPKIVTAGTPRVCIPGHDTFSLPKTKKAIHRPILVKQPKPVQALPFRMKDDANCNIQYLDVEQGMISSYVRSIIEDRNGNLWFGTEYGGVSKYDGKTFTHFTDKEGLCHVHVLSSLEDKSGNLWFGTYGGGVSKYDGKSFTHFTVNEGLNNNAVNSILEDKAGNLWFGTEGGVSKFDGKNFIHFTEKEGLSNNFVWSIAEDENGNMWFGTDGGVSKYNGKTFSHYTVREGLSNNKVWSILVDKSGNLWFGTYGGGVSKFDGKTFTHFTGREGLSNNKIMSSLEDKSGNLWFGTNGGGVSKYDGKKFTHYTKKNGLSFDVVWSIYEDSARNIWFGTYGGGVSKYDGKLFNNYTDKEGLSNTMVFSILEDKTGNLWFGTFGGGVSKYDGKSFTHYTEKEGLNRNFVRSILEDKSGNLWFGTNLGGVSKFDGKTFTHFTEKEGLGNNSILSIFEDKSGNLWFGTDGGGVWKYDGKKLSHFTQKQGLTNNIVWSVLEDKSGNLWFGTEGGVTKFDGKTYTHYSEKEGLTISFVNSILEDKTGNLWFGTNGRGVWKYDGKSFTNFTEREGLSHNFIASIVEDKSGNLWVGTSKGLSCIKKVRGISSTEPQQSKAGVNSEIIVIRKEDGLKGEDFFLNSVLLDKKNRIWWGTGKALSMMDMNLFFFNNKEPQIQLDQISLNEKFVDYNNIQSDSSESGEQLKKINFSGVARFHNYPINLALPHDINHLTFQFSAIDWYAAHKIQYRYKLEGLDKDWSSLTSDNKADYRSIPFGKYIFKVKAIGSAGKWSKSFEYPFEILPPWWQTRWFYLLVFFALASAISLAIWLRIKNIQKKAEEKAKVEIEKLELELKVLRSQMNPHFMFNALNSIESYIWNNEIKTASEYLGKFARLMRLVLENSHFDTVPIEKELEALILYLQLEAMRADFSFDYKIKNETGLDLQENKITPMLLQPFAENAILHGLSPLKERKGMVEISISKLSDEKLRVIILDNGVGRKISNSERVSFGMSLTRERILKLNQNNENALTIADLKDPVGNPVGTEVTIYLPFDFAN